MRTIQRYHRSGWFVVLITSILLSINGVMFHQKALYAIPVKGSPTPSDIGKPTLTPTLFTTPIIIPQATPTFTITGQAGETTEATPTATLSPTTQQTPSDIGKPTFTPTTLAATSTVQATATNVSRETLTPTPIPTFVPLATATQELFFYLPSVIRDDVSITIQGSVKQNGLAVNQLAVSLMATNGVVEHLQQSTITRLDGSYRFLRVPALETGYSYYVRYDNETNTAGRVEHWETPHLSGVELGEVYTYESFDISDVLLRIPSDGVTVGFPVTFRWTKRNGSPSDLYFVRLYSPADHFATESNPVGYSPEQITINCLPSPNPGFIPSATNRWRIRIQAPDGGTGYSLGTRGISFGWIEIC